MATKNDLKNLKTDLGIRKEANCSYAENEEYAKLLKEGQPLPDGVIKISEYSEEYSEFRIITESELSKDELAEYVQLCQLKNLITIKKCVLFFTITSIISIIGGLIGILAALA